ncbi:acylphosphatase [Burkholderiales bacterium JOSHI_001]|nr:acylphosphatase [Burkholderiales bacterium JOSHI_001]
MSQSLIQCIYASAAAQRMDTADLAALLRTARHHNERLGLTGMLLYADGSFFQVLEGPQDAVDATYARIEADPRHSQVTRIIREPIPRRFFSAWSMGFCQAGSPELAGLAGLDGVNRFFDQDEGAPRMDAGRARKLLAAFRAGRWRQQLAGQSQFATA